MLRPPSRARLPIALLTMAAGVALLARASFSSDHQDTPEVELNPRLDINDVYAFPGSSEDRIVFAVTTSSPLTPAKTSAARFDPNALYQIKIDNSGDAVEDLVIQFVFDDQPNGDQTVNVIGPIRPAVTGSTTRMAAATPTLTGNFNATFGSATVMQVFAGPRDDPFYIDLEQFFRILPDRRPSRGPLAALGPNPSASSFRSPTAAPQGPFAPGPAVDFLRGLNALAIVVELPESQVRGSSGNNIGVWATISR
ncbi:MAG: DUF4331 family protein [Gemmatimonadota bacterium]